MKWSKKGLIFTPSGQRSWMRTHATHPIALHLNDDLYRIYFSCRDDRNRSHVGYVELDLKAPREILRLSDEPALIPGPLGNFDDYGAYAGCLVLHRDRLWMYYLGWNPGVKPPLFYSSIGLAVSKDGGKSFHKVSAVPIVERSKFDPCSVLLPYVMKERQKWRMWYGSGMKWEEVSGELYSYYDIKYAESDDGMNWERRGMVCIPLQKNERNIGHPFVMKDEIYRMWYSHSSGHGYRIGYAESADGFRWTRKDDEVGIGLSESGWDSNALAHPHVLVNNGRRYMIYNGNDFGKDGFGLAEEV
jgi:predicted GH43/DUF377 family glycosyl hydrolase